MAHLRSCAIDGRSDICSGIRSLGAITERRQQVAVREEFTGWKNAE